MSTSPDLQLYYIEAGSGTPIIFIPGWIGTSSFYEKQVAYFSKRYRAISYDPRSQGRSSKTLENNNYIQHGADLKAFMDTLRLKDVILVGHSAGCLDIYAYLRAFGLQNVNAIVFIDNSPKTVSELKGDWVWYNSFAEMKESYAGLSHDRLNFTKTFLKSLFVEPLKEDELNWFTDELMKSPTYVALLQDYDANMSDFTKEAQMIDGKIPVLNVLAERSGWTEFAKEWLKKNALILRWKPLDCILCAGSLLIGSTQQLMRFLQSKTAYNNRTLCKCDSKLLLLRDGDFYIGGKNTIG